MPKAQLNSRHEQTALFRSNWSLYDAICEHNYMFHREIYELVGRELTSRRRPDGLSILDLGCGNARYLAPWLQAAPPRRYVGVDLSVPALDEARGFLAALEDVSLRHGDMLHTVQALGEAFDIIFSSFAVHHLQTAEKQALFEACAPRLAPGGLMLLVDVVREEGQSRDECVEGYLRMMRTEWTRVPADAIEQACAHVAAHDFPESFSELSGLAAKAGLRESRLLARFGRHAVIGFAA